MSILTQNEEHLLEITQMLQEQIKTLSSAVEALTKGLGIQTNTVGILMDRVEELEKRKC